MTEQKAATDKEVAKIKKELSLENYRAGGNGPVVPDENCYVVSKYEVKKLIARIDSNRAEIATWKRTAEERAHDCVVYQTEIERLRGLCGEAEGLLLFLLRQHGDCFAIGIQRDCENMTRKLRQSGGDNGK